MKNSVLKAVVLVLVAANGGDLSRAQPFVDGIDVAHWQGSINWNSVRNSGVEFAFIKATEGVDFVDSRFHQNMQGATSAGVLAGPYHFARPDSSYTNPLDPINEANDFLSEIQPYYDSGSYLPPVLDVERFDIGDLTLQQTRTFISNWVQDFSDTVVASLGVRPIIYTGKSAANTYFNSTVASQHELWMAWWKGSTASPPTQSDAPSWPLWDYWQYSATGSVPGISGNVDLDVFNGTRQELEAQLIGEGTGGSNEFTMIESFDVDEGYFGSSLQFSGSNQGIGAASTANRVTSEAQDGAGSQELFIDGDSSGWFLRHVSGIGSFASPAGNLAFDTTGYLGLWLKTDSPGLTVRPAIDAPDTADRGVAKDVVADGEWHLYEWNLEDDAEWQAWVNGDGIIDAATATLDSIQFTGSGAATLFLDSVSHNPAGRAPPDRAKRCALRLPRRAHRTACVRASEGAPAASSPSAIASQRVLATSRELSAAFLTSRLRVRLGQQARELREPHALGHRLRLAARPHEAEGQQPLGPALGVDPVGDAGVLVRQNESIASIGVDHDLVSGQARLALEPVARLEPRQRVDGVVPVVGIRDFALDDETLAFLELPEAAAVRDVIGAARRGSRRSEDVRSRLRVGIGEIAIPVHDALLDPGGGPFEGTRDARRLERSGPLSLAADPLDVEHRDRVVLPIALVDADHEDARFRVTLDPVHGGARRSARRDAELEPPVAPDLELVERTLVVDPVLLELHVAFVEREDRLANSADAAPDPVALTRIDRRAEVDVVGIGATPLCQAIFISIEDGVHGIPRLELHLQGIDQQAREGAEALRACTGIRGKIGLEDAFAERRQASAEIPPGLSRHQRALQRLRTGHPSPPAMSREDSRTREGN